MVRNRGMLQDRKTSAWLQHFQVCARFQASQLQHTSTGLTIVLWNLPSICSSIQTIILGLQMQGSAVKASSD